MKKIIATLLLLIFTSNIASFAREIIIADNNKQIEIEKKHPSSIVNPLMKNIKLFNAESLVIVDRIEETILTVVYAVQVLAVILFIYLFNPDLKTHG